MSWSHMSLQRYVSNENVSYENVSFHVSLPFVTRHSSLVTQYFLEVKKVIHYSQLVTRNSQLVTRNSSLATRHSVFPWVKKGNSLLATRHSQLVTRNSSLKNVPPKMSPPKMSPTKMSPTKMLLAEISSMRIHLAQKCSRWRKKLGKDYPFCILCKGQGAKLTSKRIFKSYFMSL